MMPLKNLSVEVEEEMKKSVVVNLGTFEDSVEGSVETHEDKPSNRESDKNPSALPTDPSKLNPLSPNPLPSTRTNDQVNIAQTPAK